MKRVAGAGLVALPFLGLFAFLWVMMGPLEAVAIFAVTFGIAWLMVLGCHWLWD